MMLDPRPVLLACAWLLALAPVASAQPMSEVVVIPMGTPALTSPIAITDSLESEFAAAQVPFIPLHDARDRFTARSRAAKRHSESDLDVLDRAAHETIEHVAFGRTAAAQRSVREVLSRAERTLESLNRETKTARSILDACLSLVRSVLQSGKRDLALEQATSCRRLVPDLMPSQQVHPANVVGVLAEADNMLRRMHIGHLTVRSAPETGCSVYVNGRHLGTTPFRLERAAAGTYRVQVECGSTLARVHVVELGDQPISLFVDTQLDRAVASDPRLLLRYETAQDAREQAISHATQLGREIGAADVILVGLRNERAELLRVQVHDQRVVARALVPWNEPRGFSRRAIEQAIAALTEGRLDGEPSLWLTKVPAAEPAVSEQLPTPEQKLLHDGQDVDLGPSADDDQLRTPGLESERRKLSMEGDAERARSVVLSPSPIVNDAPGARKRRWYKSPWLWGGLSVAAVAVAAGVGYAASRREDTPSPYGGSAGITLRAP